MYFTDGALVDLRRELATVPGKQSALQKRYLRHAFTHERAKEFAHHGFVRRLKTLSRCIKNVFTLIPPERVKTVDSDTRTDAEINIQASVFSVFAAADNLAWIWVFECGVRRPDGTELPESWVGLRKRNTFIRNALPATLKTSIERFDKWFDVLDDYRHALAHRIPLYIPPYNVDPANAERYGQLEMQKSRALVSGDIGEHERALSEQRKLEFFRPWMQHSFGEKAKPLVFHPQLLANFNTIEELGRLVLGALPVTKQ